MYKTKIINLKAISFVTLYKLVGGSVFYYLIKQIFTFTITIIYLI